ncbi:amino acid permease [Streptomyces malaysiensis]|uniref:Gamma-aminobutyrate (GABA) permease n=1 Tax=Streptomyces malaysiensis TaxID=92644 RepID=A0A7X5XC91_STRMQ|nr:amino acid permease [Streptomyces malaysiensis]NIY69281.1 gamma-aminobutyrate (GABA) permease [Streptomyces malaysiensis]
MSSSPESTQALKPVLGRRQLSMIAVGGTIGAGLFVGSGSAIHSAGPGVILAYVAVGALVVLIMRMLAELAVNSPDTGSFASYATRELGAWAGLAVGWVYAYTWAIVVGFEATAGAAMIHRLVPGVPAWVAALVFMVVLTFTNLISVRTFGELEFWFASVKVVIIVGFLVLGAAAIIGLVPGVDRPGLSNLTGHGGFLPNGFTEVLLAILVVVFSFFGTEVVTIAAGEAKNPREAVRAAMRSVVLRILVFYIGSIAVIVTLLPTNSSDVTTSPFVAVMEHIGLPLAPQIMDFVVITAVLSCLNSGIYTSSRMLFSLASRGEAPAVLARTNDRGVPVLAVLAASVGGFLTVIANYFLPSATVFTFLLDSTGAVAIIIYICIGVTQLRGRARLRQEGNEDLPVRMWGHPYLSALVVVALAVIMIALVVSESSRHSTLMSLIVTAVACAAGLIHQSNRRRAVPADPSPTEAVEAQ